MIPEAFATTTIAREGDAGAAWLAELPAIVDDLLDRWQCEPDGEVMYGGVGVIVPVRHAVLKVSFPHPGNVHEPDAFVAWDGCGHGGTSVLRRVACGGQRGRGAGPHGEVMPKPGGWGGRSRMDPYVADRAVAQTRGTREARARAARGPERGRGTVKGSDQQRVEAVAKARVRVGRRRRVPSGTTRRACPEERREAADDHRGGTNEDRV